jgi:RNA polymerase sigma-70 factor (ECF subfamily)
VSADPHRDNVVELPGAEPDNEEIVRGLLASDPRAAATLHDVYGGLINRLVWRLLGADPEHDDVVHQVFVNVLDSVHKVNNPAALGSWISGVTINTVRRELRSRRYRRFLRPVAEVEIEVRQEPIVRSFYAAVETMAADDRIAFILKYVEGRSLPEVAATVGCSLATAKRRIARAREIFVERARDDEALSAAVEDMKHEG